MPVPLFLLLALCLALTPPLVLLSDRALDGLQAKQVFSIGQLLPDEPPELNAVSATKLP